MAAAPYGGDDRDGATLAAARRRHRWGRTLLIIFVVLVLAMVGSYFYLDSRLHRADVLSDYAGRPADTPGTNWLIVGSDSREGLSAKQRKSFATGQAAGRRTDTMMLLHIGDHGTTLVSLPRDSYVPDPRPRPQQAQRRVRVRRPQAAGPYGRGGHADPHRPLRRDRLRRVRRHGRRRRRREHVHQAADEGPQGRASTSSRAARRSRAARPSASSAPARSPTPTWSASRTSASSWPRWSTRRRARPR